MKVYMSITKDALELPEAVADSPKELARMCGVKYEHILSAISHWKKGRIKTPRFITCELEEDTQ